ncbi:MAG: Hsp70 family protein, partial [Deltaproteobacteria bacterium]|nr:Hsp70 family protein [Deltaproteobacteria bacterium]
GLSEEEIDRLVKDAESHAEEDKKKRELIDTRNQADALIYSVEKNMKEMADKIDSGDKSRIEDAIQKLKKALEGDDLSAMQSAQEELTQASHKLAEAMYARASSQQEAAGAGASEGGHAQAGGAGSDDDVVDADFEEVK